MPGNEGEKTDDINERIAAFVQSIKLGSTVGSYNIAIQTVKLLVRVTSQKQWSRARDLLDLIRSDGRRMIAADPTNTTIGNMVRRVLKIIRNEYIRNTEGKSEEEEAQHSLQKVLLTDGTVEDFSKPCYDLKATVIEAINELMSEIETSIENIASQSLEYIHANEVIMTSGYSKTILSFLKNAAKSRKFQVIITECAPTFLSQKLARELAEAGIETTVINDSAVFAIMSRVNKVIISTHTVIANGGLKAISGSHVIALAAKHYSVPFLVCAPMYKLSPQFLISYDQDSFNKFLSPKDVLGYAADDVVSKVQVYNPVFDYVPPDLVTLYVSNIGGNAPSYVYRLLSEMYHPEDHDL